VCDCRNSQSFQNYNIGLFMKTDLMHGRLASNLLIHSMTSWCGWFLY